MRKNGEIKKAKEIILALIEESGGGFAGKTRLCKAFYFAHLFHFRGRDGLLSHYPIVRMPHGPGIDHVDELIAALTKERRIQIGHRMNGPYREDVYTLCAGGADLKPDERESIKEAIEWIGDKSAAALSEITHEFSRSWQESSDGQELNIYADLLDESEHRQLKQRQEKIREDLDEAFGQTHDRLPAQAAASGPRKRRRQGLRKTA